MLGGDFMEAKAAQGIYRPELPMGEKSEDSFSLRKGVEGYIVQHSWRVERKMSDSQMEKFGPYPQHDYKSEEFAYTSKTDAIAKLVDIVA